LCTLNKVPSGFRNEAHSLFYDAKSDVTSCVAELKAKLIERKTAFENHAGVTIDFGSSMSKERLK
jgi:hypothetical protein